MSNIREIEINGVVYGIESVNDIYVGKEEPTSEVKPNIWIRPRAVWLLRNAMGMERKAGSTSSYGDYTLDDSGNLVETTDTTMIGHRTTRLFPVFHDKQYKLAFYNTFHGEPEYFWSVYFYNINKEFISKADFEPEEVQYAMGSTALDLNLPAGTRFIRILAPYNYESTIVLCDGDTEASEIIDASMMGVTDKFYEYDGDHYVLI